MIKELLFLGLICGLFYFLLIYLPKKNKQVNREHLIPIDENLENAASLCEEFHSSVWLDTAIHDKKFCTVCGRYR